MIILAIDVLRRELWVMVLFVGLGNAVRRLLKSYHIIVNMEVVVSLDDDMLLMCKG